MKSLRELFRLTNLDADVRDKLRMFNMSAQLHGKARSVKELAESIGLSVIERDLQPGHNGLLERDAFSDSGYAIVVNRRIGVRAKRFAALHELCHYLLHTDKEDYFAEPINFDLSGGTFYLDTFEERQANEAAETLLFGDGALEAARGLFGSNVAHLAKAFGVTENVMKIAMKRF